MKTILTILTALLLFSCTKEDRYEKALYTNYYGNSCMQLYIISEYVYFNDSILYYNVSTCLNENFDEFKEKRIVYLDKFIEHHKRENKKLNWYEKIHRILE